MFFSISETLTYQTLLLPDEIIACLHEAIEPPRKSRFNWGLWSNHKKYEGKIEGFTFKMSKIPEGKNSTFAEAEGSILPQNDYTLVKVQLSMPIFIRIFAVFWLSFVSFAIMMSFVVTTKSPAPFPFNYIPVAMFIVGILLFFGGYKWNATELKNDLKTILQADIVESTGF